MKFYGHRSKTDDCFEIYCTLYLQFTQNLKKIFFFSTGLWIKKKKKLINMPCRPMTIHDVLCEHPV